MKFQVSTTPSFMTAMENVEDIRTSTPVPSIPGPSIPRIDTVINSQVRPGVTMNSSSSGQDKDQDQGLNNCEANDTQNNFPPFATLRTMVVPEDLVDNFLSIAEQNTIRGVETLGLICGKLNKDNKYIVTHLLIPKQTCTKDNCTMIGSEDIWAFHDKARVNILIYKNISLKLPCEYLSKFCNMQIWLGTHQITKLYPSITLPTTYGLI